MKTYEEIQAMSIGEITEELYRLGAFINYIKSECVGTLLIVEYQGWLTWNIAFSKKEAFEFALDDVYYTKEEIESGREQPFNINEYGRRKDGKKR